MTFREQATADLSTFLNVDEFGETVDIDGVTVACVLEPEETPDNLDGVSSSESNMYVRATDFETPPVVRQRLTVGDRQADVIRVEEQQGILVLRLRWFDS